MKYYEDLIKLKTN